MSKGWLAAWVLMCAFGLSPGLSAAENAPATERLDRQPKEPHKDPSTGAPNSSHASELKPETDQETPPAEPKATPETEPKPEPKPEDKKKPDEVPAEPKTTPETEPKPEPKPEDKKKPDEAPAEPKKKPEAERKPEPKPEDKKKPDEAPAEPKKKPEAERKPESKANGDKKLEQAPPPAPPKAEEPAKKPVTSLNLTIKLALMADPSLFPLSVEVEMDHQKATLSGIVPSEGDKTKAAQIAKSIEGVESVTNKLTVDPAVHAAWVKKQDETITQLVKERLNRSETLKAVGFDVKTENGVVSISGKTHYQVIALEAAEAARHVPGVRAVTTSAVQLIGKD